MNRYLVNALAWSVIAVVVVVVAGVIYFLLPLYRPGVPRQEIVYSAFITRAEQGTVRQVTIHDGRITGLLGNGEPFVTFGPVNDETLKILRAKGVRIQFEPASGSALLAYAIPVLTFVIGLLVGRVRRKRKD